MKDIIETIALSLIMFAITVFIIMGCVYIEFIQDESCWNNGNCPSCGQEWEFLGVNVIHEKEHEYVYHCSNCKVSIFLPFEY